MAGHGVPRVSSKKSTSQGARDKELEQIKSYRNLVDDVNLKVAENQFTGEVLSLTSNLLSQNPEYYTIWNYRRLILLHGLFPKSNAEDQGEAPSFQKVVGLIRTDLNFLVPLLRQYPKCYWIWKYRIWLLQESIIRLPASFAAEIWRDERKLVDKMLVLDRRNFHGWGYRRLVMEQLRQFDLDSKDSEDYRKDPPEKRLTEEEFEYTTKMIKTDLSNFSAWHYRSKLIPEILDIRAADDAARLKLLNEEFELILPALWTDPSDQSLWFYHQWLMSNLTSALSPDASAASPVCPNIEDYEALALLRDKIDDIREIVEYETECKWIYEALFRYTLQLRLLETDDAPDSTDLRTWLERLRELDPLRNGRWDDWQKELGRSTRG
ncbi:MAG: hypothetical protein M4579_003006 [Chaenotheca gracillima]|nr:MAG: hypothetical protein M4579_003006 [Chaenotheca gracillima]